MVRAKRKVLASSGLRSRVQQSNWHVYILRCGDGTLYTGIAADLERRLGEHQRGVAAKYTRSRGPLALAYQEAQPDRSHALKREAALRRLGREGKLALIAGRDEGTDS